MISLTHEQEALLQEWLHDESFCQEHLRMHGAGFIRMVIKDQGYAPDYQSCLNRIRENWIEFKYFPERNY